MGSVDLTEYTIQGNRDIAKALAENNLRWVRLRWYYMVLLAVVAMATTFLSALTLTRVYEYGLILVAGYVVNIAIYLLICSAKDRLSVQRFALGAQLFLDLFMCAVIIYVQGGIDARTTMLFAIPIIASGLAFIQKLVIPVAALSGLMYVASILVHGYASAGTIDWTQYAVPVVFYPLLFLVLGRIVEFLAVFEASTIRERAYDSFLSLVAHQLKHPASASKTIVDVMQHDDLARHTGQTRHYLELLRAESDNQVRVIDNLLEAAPRDIHDSHPERINIVLLVEKVAHRVAQGHQRLDDLVRDHGAGGAIVVRGDAIKLQLALTNIFDNCFRHTDDGVAVKYGIHMDDGEVTVTISDRGDGMNKKQLQAMSQRFAMRGDHELNTKHVGGLGLGLYVAKRIVTAHNGTFTVQSREGHGTTVTVRMKGAIDDKSATD